MGLGNVRDQVLAKRVSITRLRILLIAAQPCAWLCGAGTSAYQLIWLLATNSTINKGSGIAEAYKLISSQRYPHQIRKTLLRQWSSASSFFPKVPFFIFWGWLRPVFIPLASEGWGRPLYRCWQGHRAVVVSVITDHKTHFHRCLILVLGQQEDCLAVLMAPWQYSPAYSVPSALYPMSECDMLVLWVMN